MIKLLGAFKPASWAKFGVYTIGVVALYFSTLKWLIGHDWQEEDFNYCYLIPFIVLYFIWEKREKLASLRSRPSWKGLVPFCLGLAFFWFGELSGEYFTLYISLWLVIVGLVWIHFGWEKIKAIWFALVMMLGMFPLPSIINVRLTFGLKLLSSWLGVAALQLCGMSAYREGNIIDLGFTQLQVVEACSGLRYLIPLAILSLILAYWAKGHIWKKIFLFLSSIPIAIAVNSLRIAATGVLYGIWGARVAEGFFHGFSGWLIFMFTLPVLFLELWVLGELPPREHRPWTKAEVPGEAGNDEAAADRSAQLARAASPPGKFFRPAFVAVVVLLGLTLVLSKTVEFREHMPIKKPLGELPLQLAEWTGKRDQMEQQFIDALHFTDYAMVDYEGPGGKSINFYTAYYESQRKGEGTHSPETCLPGSGWLFREAGPTDVQIGPGRSIRVNRAFMEKMGQRELTYYWFAMRGRTLTSLYQVKFYTFWDALVRQRSDGALVRLITPIYQAEKMEDAEARLQGFTKLIVPVLRAYIPE
jgi:exosortase D (VPLPA-CTERM-specific)